MNNIWVFNISWFFVGLDISFNQVTAKTTKDHPAESSKVHLTD